MKQLFFQVVNLTQLWQRELRCLNSILQQFQKLQLQRPDTRSNMSSESIWISRHRCKNVWRRLWFLCFFLPQCSSTKTGGGGFVRPTPLPTCGLLTFLKFSVMKDYWLLQLDFGEKKNEKQWGSVKGERMWRTKRRTWESNMMSQGSVKSNQTLQKSRTSQLQTAAMTRPWPKYVRSLFNCDGSYLFCGEAERQRWINSDDTDLRTTEDLSVMIQRWVTDLNTMVKIKILSD